MATQRFFNNPPIPGGNYGWLHGMQWGNYQGVVVLVDHDDYNHNPLQVMEDVRDTLQEKNVEKRNQKMRDFMRKYDMKFDLEKHPEKIPDAPQPLHAAPHSLSKI